MGGNVPKQFLPLKGKPVIWHTIKAFIEAYEDMQFILVLPETFMEKGNELAKEFPYNRFRFTIGGETRFHSVKNGLVMVDNHAIVFVHDAARCLVNPTLIQRCGEEANRLGNAIPATHVTDSLRVETRDGNEVVDRHKIRVIQTPQTFHSDILREAFTADYEPAFTDEATVVERTGVKINLVEGDPDNIKITQPLDLLIAEKILDQRESKM